MKNLPFFKLFRFLPRGRASRYYLNKNKIIETYQFNTSYGWDVKKSKPGKYKLIHYMNNERRVIKTQRKWLKGGFLEDFDSVTYEYNGNLLIKANYFSGIEETLGMKKDEPYKILFYEYE